MYNFKCNKKFKNDLNIPDISYRYSSIVGSDKKNIIFIKDHFDNTTFRYRAYNIIQSMKNNSKYNFSCFRVDETHILYDILDKIDLVILQRATWTFELDSFVHVLKDNNIKIIFDVDDLIYHSKYAPKYLNSIGDYMDSEIDKFFAYTRRYEMIAEKCDGYIVTTKDLCKNIKDDFNKPVWVFHNYLNLEQEKVSKDVIELKKKSFSDEKFIIGYFSGSFSHKRDLEIVESAIVRLMEEYDDIYLKIVGYMNLPPKLKKLKNQKRIFFSNYVSYEELEYEIGKVDLNIIPLQKHEFNECKSELKYFEASIVNTISCATDNNVYGNVINDGIDGFLADEISWFDKIEYIYLNYNKLDNIVNNARNKCLKEYGSKEQRKGIEEMYDDIFETLM